jgi:hypothetical protein
MEARDVNQVVFLQTEIVDISGFTNVAFSLDVTEYGDHEGLYFGLDACADQDKEDYVNVLFRVDGGPWNLVSNVLGWCGLYASCGSHTLYGDDGINSGDCRDHDDDWGSATISNGGLSGNSLEIRIETINSATDEIIRFDNLMVKGDMVLPVTLKEFDVEVRESSVRINWRTAAEVNHDYFEIERTDLPPGMEWEAIARIPGSGTRYEPKDYYYEDPDPYPGRSYYRLKQVDFDGKVEYSGIKSAMIRVPMVPYPNPAKDRIMIPLAKQHRYPAVRIFDISSVEIYQETKISENHIYLDVSRLSSGNYIIRVNEEAYRMVLVK